MSEPPKPGCSGTITSKRFDRVSQNGSQAEAPRAPCRNRSGSPDAAAHQAGLAAGDGNEAFLMGHVVQISGRSQSLTRSKVAAKWWAAGRELCYSKRNVGAPTSRTTEVVSETFTLADLALRVKERAKASAEESYTRKLLDKGIAHCAKKLGEEAVETALAAVAEDRERLTSEAADLLYHLLVVLEARGVELAEVEAALAKRRVAVGPGRKGVASARVEPELSKLAVMEQRTDPQVSPYRIFRRPDWAALRADHPMTLSSEEVATLRSMHDRLDMEEVEDIYLPLSRLLAMYLAAAQRLFRAQQSFLGTEDSKVPYIIGVAGSVAVGKSHHLARAAGAAAALAEHAEGRHRHHRRLSLSECGAGARRPDGEEGLSGKLRPAGTAALPVGHQGRTAADARADLFAHRL